MLLWNNKVHNGLLLTNSTQRRKTLPEQILRSERDLADALPDAGRSRLKHAGLLLSRCADALDCRDNIGVAHPIREFNDPLARDVDALRHYSICPVDGL